MKPRKTHAALLRHLQEHEATGQTVTIAEMLAATGWKAVSLETYIKKGQLSEYLSELAPGLFAVSNTANLDALTFSRNLSQSKNRRALGFNCKSGLAKALLHKARDNMMLALELYNRPSLDNRLDAFVLCFCTAWEQLLKAALIERDGEASIFKPGTTSAGIRETISLRECLTRFFKRRTAVQRNIERIAFYRDQAVHLLMPEVQGIASRVFQSGVMNFGKAFSEFAEQDFLPSSNAGMLSLVGDLNRPSNATIMSKYGVGAGAEVIQLLESLAEETKSEDDIEFAVPLNVKLVFAKTDDQGNSITLSKAEAGMEGLANAIVIEKPVERSKTHPFRMTGLVDEINRRISERYDPQHVERYLRVDSSEKQRTKINNFDVSSVSAKLGWRNSNNGFHYRHENPETHYYSEAAVDDFIEKVFSEPDFLRRARKSYSGTDGAST